jgi:hypothetical protein
MNLLFSAPVIYAGDEDKDNYTIRFSYNAYFALTYILKTGF